MSKLHITIFIVSYIIVYMLINVSMSITFFIIPVTVNKVINPIKLT